MKNKKYILVFVVVIVISIIVFIVHNNNRPKEISATEYLQLQYKGLEGTGWINIESNNIPYDGDNLYYFYQFVDSFSYNFSKTSDLSNGDEIHVSVVSYDENIAKYLNLKVVDTEKDFVVEGLVGESIITEVRQEESYSFFGNTYYVDKIYYIIDGVEIPDDWNLSDQEKANYVRYAKCIDENPDDFIDVCHYERDN